MPGFKQGILGTFLVYLLYPYRAVYSWLLNDVGLTHVGPFIWIFFNKYSTWIFILQIFKYVEMFVFNRDHSMLNQKN